MAIITAQANDLPLAEKHRDHALTGNWKDHRYCHVKPDLVLIYRKPDDAVLQLLTQRAWPVSGQNRAFCFLNLEPSNLLDVFNGIQTLRTEHVSSIFRSILVGVTAAI